MHINKGWFRLKESTYLICRIIFTSLFLIISTVIWSNRRVSIYHNMNNSVSMNEITITDISKYNNDNIYHLKLENTKEDTQNIKLYIVPDVLKENINNNYIKYQINNKDIKTLNTDGMILVDKINGLEEKNIDVKLWVSDTYVGEQTYSGRIVIA